MTVTVLAPHSTAAATTDGRQATRHGSFYDYESNETVYESTMIKTVTQHVLEPGAAADPDSDPLTAVRTV